MTLIDKAALLNKIATEVHYDSEHSLEMYAKMLSLINDAPDGVVRCKDCRYWDTNGYGAEYDSEGYGWCEEIGEFDTKKDWYCGWGERKEDAKTN